MEVTCSIYSRTGIFITNPNKTNEIIYAYLAIRHWRDFTE